jgi:uncharacterized membrane protein YsdA (DUF1294 family)
VPHPALIIYVGCSLVAIVLFGIDKRAARLGRRRIRESTLHGVEFVGGFPGALAAQQLFRHKRAKPSFFLVTWLIAALHVAGWVWWWQA